MIYLLFNEFVYDQNTNLYMFVEQLQKHNLESIS